MADPRVMMVDTTDVYEAVPYGEPDAADLATFLTARPALLDDLLLALPQDAARAVVRAYLARDPEAAARVAGAWEDRAQLRVRNIPGRNDCAAFVARMGDRWIGHIVVPVSGDCMVNCPAREEAEAAVDALLRADGWVLGEGAGMRAVVAAAAEARAVVRMQRGRR